MVFARRLRPKASALLLFVALVLLLPKFSPVVLAQEGSLAQSLIQQAFREVNQAEGAGGNVSSLVSSLNGAVALSSEADRLQNSNPGRAAQLSSQAEAIATQVIAEALTAREAATASRQVATEVYVVELLALAGMGALVYRYGPRILWRLWYELHSDWSVRG